MTCLQIFVENKPIVQGFVQSIILSKISYTGIRVGREGFLLRPPSVTGRGNPRSPHKFFYKTVESQIVDPYPVVQVQGYKDPMSSSSTDVVGRRMGSGLL